MGTKVNYAFLHGGSQGSWVWHETIAALKLQAGDNTGQLLALDVPGCGKKKNADTFDTSFDDIIEELLSDIDSAGATDLVLVGHSQAGTVLPAMVNRRPELFQRLIYISCSIPLQGQTVLEMIGEGIHGSVETEVGWPVDTETMSMRQRTQIMLCNDMDQAAKVAFMEKLGGDQWPGSSYTETNWELAASGTVPATYVICLQDNILPVPWQNTFADRLQAQRVVRVDAGHQVQNTRPHALAEIIRQETRS